MSTGPKISSRLAFASAGSLDLDEVYRRELTVLGSRSATPRHMRDAAGLLSELDLPEPAVFPLEWFADGLAAYRERRALSANERRRRKPIRARDQILIVDQHPLQMSHASLKQPQIDLRSG